MPRLPTSRPLRMGAIIALQAGVWVVLALAFAALIELAGWSSWRDALVFSATNWLPWIVLAPVVFWLAWRFPFERGRLLRRVPLHLVACAACCVAMLWVSAYFAPYPRFVRGGVLRDGRPGGAPGGARDLNETAPRALPEGERGGEKMERREKVEAGGRGERPAPRAGEAAGMERPPPREPRPKGPPGSGPGPDFGRRPGGPRPGMMGESLVWRFWPPFSSIALRANVSASIYLIVACVAHAFSYYRRAQQREREAIALTAGLSRAKLDALRAQLQPHFLFNTLNAISTLVHRDANAADELIGDLSELLRLSLQTSEHEVPLARELELLDCYLAIERARLGERLRLVREVDPAALVALVPTFVLQPLAENAIRHGIEPRRGPGTLTVRAEVVGGNVRLVVADDGVGLQPASASGGRRGIGIANTEERLRALHGEAAHLDLVSPEAGGVQVQVVLPLRTTARAEAGVSADAVVGNEASKLRREGGATA